MFLVRPSARYKTTFLEGLKEFHKESRNLRYDVSELEKDFDSFVKGLRKKEEVVELSRGKVPESVFWLIDNGEYVGRISIRHWLNDYHFNYGGHIGYEIRPARRKQGFGTNILRLGLAEARRIGLEKVLLTCSQGNIGSVKIIETNGGILENKVRSERDGSIMNRYWISVS